MLVDTMTCGAVRRSINMRVHTHLQFKPPRIMLTGDIADAHVKKAMRIADRILPKPVDITLLLRDIEALLDKRP